VVTDCPGDGVRHPEQWFLRRQSVADDEAAGQLTGVAECTDGSDVVPIPLGLTEVAASTRRMDSSANASSRRGDPSAARTSCTSGEDVALRLRGTQALWFTTPTAKAA
jgi:hypothetical protein